MLVSIASALTPQDAEARLRMARQIARERNDRELVQRVEKLAREFKAGLPAEAEDDQKVCGAIIALEDDAKLRQALRMVPMITFYRYQISFKLVKC